MQLLNLVEVLQLPRVEEHIATFRLALAVPHSRGKVLENGGGGGVRGGVGGGEGRKGSVGVF